MSEKLTNLTALVSLAEETSSDKRRELLRNVTDLFFEGHENHTESEIDLFGDIMGTISCEMEAEIRKDISERMAHLEKAPKKLINDLARDELDVAAPVLEHSPIVDDDVLVEIAETESQVCDHLDSHLDRLPDEDARSRAIVTQMRDEEMEHGDNAREAGAAELPEPVRELMKLTARVMTSTAYRV